MLSPIKINPDSLEEVIDECLSSFSKGEYLDGIEYAKGSYSPTPTIIEAALNLYGNHSVEEITRTDAAAMNLTQTSNEIDRIIETAKKKTMKKLYVLSPVFPVLAKP